MTRILDSNISGHLQSSLGVGNASSSLSSFEKFCGNSPFWDTRLLLDGSYPEFTQCFRQVGVSWIPCLGYIAACIPYICYLLLQPCVPARRVGLVGIAKTICLICLLIISMVTIIMRSQHKDTSNVLYVSEGLKAVVFILIMLVTSEERRKGIIASPVTWTFWFFLFSLNIIPFYSNFKEDKLDSDRFGFIIFLIYYFFVFLSLIIASFVETRKNDYKDISADGSSFECPMLISSIPSKLLFSWMTKLVILAYKKPLDENDVFELRPQEKLATNQPKFERTWQKEKRKIDKYNDKVRSKQKVKKTPVRDQNVNEESPLVSNRRQSQSPGTKGEKSPYKRVSVFKTLMSNHGLLMISALIVKALADCFALVTPKITEALLEFVEHRERYPKWRGFALASSYLVVGALSSMVGNQAVFYTKVAAIRMKVSLVNAVYRKSLTAASIGDDTSKGEINNLMSVSAQRIQDLSLDINMLISAPAQVCIALYLLYNQLGAAVFAGLAIMFLTIPVNGAIAFMYEKWQMRMMTYKDKRNGLLSEILNGIKVLKLYAWELSFQEKVRFIRNQELSLVLYIQYLMAIMSFFFQALPSLVQITAFGVYIHSAGYLDATVCFVSLQLFNMLNGPLMIMPLLIPTVIQTGVSFTRIANYLNKSDIKSDSIRRDSNAENAVEIRNGNFTWALDQPLPTLRNINMEVPTGSLVAVVGTVGCGKSTLMSAILGETEKLSGDVTVQGSTAYVPQEAWIQNASLRDNILFGQDYRNGQYDRVIEACALKSDLDILPGGDMTEIGEKGINISGGQKQRVSLARAVYSNRDIFLLDDPLSAVDSHVGKHIFDKVIGEKGVLKNKTRILVTHGIHWLPMVDKIYVMTHGQITEMGSYAELLERDGAFARFIKEYAQETEKKEEAETEGDEEEESTRSRRSRKLSVRSDGSIDLSDLNAIGESEKMEAIAGSKLTDEEFGMSGSVKASTYLYFLKQVGAKSCFIGLTLYIMNAGCNIFSAIWLTKWTGNDYLHNRSNEHTDKYSHLTRMYLGVYAAGGIAGGLCVFIFFIIAAVRLTDASRKLHNNMLASVLRAPMLFFDTTPMGRILNRFTMDVEIVDQLLPMSLNQLLNVFCTVIVTIVNISYGTPIFLAALVPLVVIYIGVQTLYIPTCRQLRRIESITRSPIYVHFSETLNGADSIRAYGCQERFIEESVKKVDHNVKFFFASSAAIGWLTVWLNFLGNMVMFLAAIFAVVATDISPSVVGLSVSFASSMTMALGNMVNGMSDTETNAVSVERIKEYTHVEPEAPWARDDYKPKPEWPAMGNIAFDNYQTRYRPGLDLVLQDVSCTIKGGEKIGIVGRTGAGKSSMTVALFRIIEAAGGKIIIDGEDVSKMGLHDLRSKITILPQDPVIFFGSMRMNLDPFDMYSDFDLWNALDLSYLKDFVEGLPGMLDYECGEEGSNLSVGQRQLVCLARTLLRKTKILVLDEATAAVDMETDDLIQKTIRKEFKDSTILTIAHRLNTIMDYDRVMVLDKGQIKEFDSPAALLTDENTVFHGMAKEAGLV